MTDYEDLYEVSDQGRVRSFDKTVIRGKGAAVFLPARVIAQFRIGRFRNYWGVTLHRGGRRKVCMVHRLVGEAFLGPLPEGLTTRHGAAGSLDNRLVNLSYGTQAQNNADKFRDGSHPVGSETGNAKLTEAIVLECRARVAAGTSTVSDLARHLGISNQSMSKAVRGLTWRHIGGMRPASCGALTP